MTIFGTSGPDLLRTSSSDDTLFGRGGNDRLVSTAALAAMIGGNGDDRLQHRIIDPGPGTSLQYGGTFLGGNGIDQIFSRVEIDSASRIDPVTVQQTVNGGRGADRISLINAVDVFDEENFFGPEVRFTTNITDLSGDNRISLQNSGFTIDEDVTATTDIRLGGGNDRVQYRGNFDGFNFAPGAEHDINLGQGNNSLDFVEFMGFASYDIRSGRGADTIKLLLIPEEGNDEGINYDINIETGNGADRVELDILEGFVIDSYAVAAQIDLGGGNNVLEVNSFFGGAFTVRANGGADRITIRTEESELSAFAPSYDIDAGGGNNIVTLDTGAPGFDAGPAVSITTGNGSDRIALEGVASIGLDAPAIRQIASGGGNDVIRLDSAPAVVSLGLGADRLITALDAFAVAGGFTNETSTVTLEITDFSLDEGDRFELRDVAFGVDALSNGVFRAQSDFDALAESDTLLFVELAGDDLSFGVAVSDNLIAEVIFRDLDDVDLSAFAEPDQSPEFLPLI